LVNTLIATRNRIAALLQCIGWSLDNALESCGNFHNAFGYFSHHITISTPPAPARTLLPSSILLL
jgi:hypothetical protein